MMSVEEPHLAREEGMKVQVIMQPASFSPNGILGAGVSALYQMLEWLC
jgi:hypothetical protein